MKKRNNSNAKTRARSLRENQTRPEGLLWSILRAKQVCGLKFRRQHPIGVWIVDFACPAKMLVIEIDGGYHDETQETDIRRQKSIEQLGWKFLRFTDEDVEEDAEVVARAVAKFLDLTYGFKRRKATGSGMMNVRVNKEAPLTLSSLRSTLPEGG